MNSDQIPYEDLRLFGPKARVIILNCHSLMRRRFMGSPLWSMVGQITGHGSGYSIQICKTANLDPMQVCGKGMLKDYVH